MLNDKRIRLALAIAIFEWVAVGGLIVVLGEDSQTLAGIIVVVATWVQLSLVFYRPRPKGAVADAQALFMQGDYANAATTLEQYLAENDNLQAQTLLGNSYRMQGELDKSYQHLKQVVDHNPTEAFPLYGLGRTLLAQGNYAAAIQSIDSALQHGGRRVIRCELALAYYLDEQSDRAAEEAKRTSRVLGLEPHRILMCNYLLLNTQADPRAQPLIERTFERGLPHWQAEADRFAETPYGKALHNQIDDIQALVAHRQATGG